MTPAAIAQRQLLRERPRGFGGRCERPVLSADSVDSQEAVAKLLDAADRAIADDDGEREFRRALGGRNVSVAAGPEFFAVDPASDVLARDKVDESDLTKVLAIHQVQF